MNAYKTLVRELLSEYAGLLRNNRHLTQEEMAERLRITSRAYSDLENGKFCFSAITLLFLIIMLDESELSRLLALFREKVYLLEQQDVA